MKVQPAETVVGDPVDRTRTWVRGELEVEDPTIVGCMVVTDFPGGLGDRDIRSERQPGVAKTRTRAATVQGAVPRQRLPAQRLQSVIALSLCPTAHAEWDASSTAPQDAAEPRGYSQR